MKTELEIGKILKPRGLKGEFKVEIYSQEPARFSNIKKIKIDNIEYSVEKISFDGTFSYFKLKDINSVEQAELLRNKSIFADKNNLPDLEKGKYYIADLIGINVIVNGSMLGTIVDVLQYGSADVYNINTKNGLVSVPAVKDLIINVDFEKNQIILNQYIFDRVAVFN